MAVRPHDDRRDSIRVKTRFMVRGLGEDREWSDSIGDISASGAGFTFPRAPEAEHFQVKFSVPGEEKVRVATGRVVDYDPLEGSRHRDDPFLVRLEFTKMNVDDRIDLACTLGKLEKLPDSELWSRLGWG